MSRDGIVGIATCYTLDDRVAWVLVPARARIFSKSSRPALRPTQTPIKWLQKALSPDVKRQERKADHLPPTSVEVKKTWIYISTLPYTLMA
jgi:hypothetical protein